jgi:hypothetical protein
MKPDYIPDRWCVLEFDSEVTGKTDKVFAGWYGGFAGADSWKLSSGIIKTEDKGDFYRFTNFSGSIYDCHKHSYGKSMTMLGMLASWQKQADDSGLFTVNEVSDYLPKRENKDG